MVVESVIEAARRPLLDLAPEIAGALVLLDAGAAEAAALSLGPAFLFGLGAANVVDLETTEPDDALLVDLTAAASRPPPGRAAPPPPPLRLVAFVTRLLPDAHGALLRALLAHPGAARLTVCCAVSELAHAQQRGVELGVEAYSEYADILKQDLAQARAAAAARNGGGGGDSGQAAAAAGAALPAIAVRFAPLHMVALDATTFVLPAAGAAAGMATAAGRAAGFGPADQPDADGDDADDGALGVAGGLSLLAHALVGAAAQLGARVEPFALGPVSAQVAREVASLPQAPAAAVGGGGGGGMGEGFSPRHAGAGGGSGGGLVPAALILIDRSLDLAAPCGHSDHFLDAAPALLLRRPPAPPPPHARGAWAAHRPADVRVGVPAAAPWDCLGPDSAGGAAAAAAAAGSSGSGSGGEGEAGGSGSSASAATSAATDNGGGNKQASPPPPAAVAAAPLLGAALFDPSDRAAQRLLDQLVARRSGKDAAQAVRKALKDALRAERAPPPAGAARVRLGAPVTAAELSALAAALAAAPGSNGDGAPAAAAAAAARQLPALAAAAAAAQVMSDPRWDAWAALAALERQIAALLDDAAAPGGGGGGGDGAAAGQALAALLTDAIAGIKAGRGVLSAADVLPLLAFMYSLSGDLTPPAPPMYSADEQAVRAALADALLASALAALPGGGGGGEGGGGSGASGGCRPLDAAAWDALPAPLQAVLADAGRAPEAELRARLDARLAECVARLRWLAAARGKLRDARRLLAPGAGAGGGAEAAPLVRQVLGKVLLQADVGPFVAPGSSGGGAGPALGGILKAGLGRVGLGLGAALGAALGEGAAAAAAGAGGGGGAGSGIIPGGGRAPRAPHEFPLVIIFVVGGISAAEWRGIRQELDQHTFGHKPAVVLGGTSLLAPADAVRLLL